MSLQIPPTHPRAVSLRIRQTLIEGWKRDVVTEAGLIAHGRGEAFDYLLGESTTPPAANAIEAAASSLILASYPVISVNGNSAALAARELVQLASTSDAKLEVNLFHRTEKRMVKVAKLLREYGATEVLGLHYLRATIPGLDSPRGWADPNGIFVADVVLVPLEDGDRTVALRRLGKKVIAVDLNPLSRTSQAASITIVDNIVRAVPRLVSEVKRLKKKDAKAVRRLSESYDNRKTLAASIRLMLGRLRQLSETSSGE